MRISPTTKGKHPSASLGQPGYISGTVTPMRGWFMDSITNNARIVDSWGKWPWETGPINVNEHFELDSAHSDWPRQVPSPIGYAWQLNHNAAIDGTPLSTVGVLPPGYPFSTADVVTSFTSDDNTIGCWFRIDGEHLESNYGVQICHIC